MPKDNKQDQMIYEESTSETFEPIRRIKKVETVEYIMVGELKPHPENETIYGNEEDITDLIPIIEAQGILDPLVITDNNVIISGHRRWKVAMHLGYSTVPCILRHYESSEEELAELLSLNVNRIKTNEQKTREGIALVETLSSDALLRKMAALKQNVTVVDDSSTTGGEASDNEGGEAVKGKTRDKVAEAVGLASGKTFDRSKAVVDKIDSLKKEGKNEEASLFVSVLNRKPTAAHDLLEVDIASLSEEVKEKIKIGKAAPRSFKKKKDDSDKPKKEPTPYVEVKKTVDDTNKEILATVKLLSNAQDLSQKKGIHKSLDATIVACRELIEAIESIRHPETKTE